MARPSKIDDEDILRAAREVFLERGIRGTTAEVAARAGVSEGAVFKRFRSKEQLFRAAMRRVDDVAWIRELPERVGRGELSEELVSLGLAAHAFFARTIPFHMMSWSNRGKTHDLSAMFEPGVEPPPLASRRRLADYFAAERARGRIAPSVDPDVLARAFVGAIYNFAAMEIMFGAYDPLPMAPEVFVRGLVAMLLRGIEPPRTAPPRSPSIR